MFYSHKLSIFNYAENNLGRNFGTTNVAVLCLCMLRLAALPDGCWECVPSMVEGKNKAIEQKIPNNRWVLKVNLLNVKISIYYL